VGFHASHPVLRSRPPAWEAAFGSDGGRIACGGFRARFKKRVSGAMGNSECFRRLVRSWPAEGGIWRV